ncbi:hypothetical protein FA15DRAFT_661521 [Coprinopsis marcescibilis]|uniref:Uncharacterized protein n=1 Tax=Coprinopsis marcescibilis TaxID=230819 RepID=A0A5C3KBN8_COPMA|nr:hypothetical protein FA15DRAFT_661521 [Coprinopsis marcescibilis]
MPNYITNTWTEMRRAVGGQHSQTPQEGGIKKEGQRGSTNDGQFLYSYAHKKARTSEKASAKGIRWSLDIVPKSVQHEALVSPGGWQAGFEGELRFDKAGSCSLLTTGCTTLAFALAGVAIWRFGPQSAMVLRQMHGKVPFARTDGWDDKQGRGEWVANEA